MRVSLNLNDVAEVTLTKFGARTYNEWEESFRLPPYNKREFKEGDTLRDQLWHLFQVFGPHLSLGCQAPFLNCEVRLVK